MIKIGIKGKILSTIGDLCSNFLHYDRKEDSQLSVKKLNDAVKSGDITVDEMVAEFRRHLEATYKTEKPKLDTWSLPDGVYKVGVDKAVKGTSDYSCRTWMKRGVCGELIVVAVEYNKSE